MSQAHESSTRPPLVGRGKLSRRAGPVADGGRRAARALARMLRHATRLVRDHHCSAAVHQAARRLRRPRAAPSPTWRASRRDGRPLQRIPRAAWRARSRARPWRRWRGRARPGRCGGRQRHNPRRPPTRRLATAARVSALCSFGGGVVAKPASPVNASAASATPEGEDQGVGRFNSGGVSRRLSPVPQVFSAGPR